MSWIIFAALGQIFWSFGNVIDKLLLIWLDEQEEDEDESDSVTQLLLFSGLAGVVVALLIVLWDYRVLFVGPTTIALLVLNGACTLAWLWFYLRAADREEISTIVPIFQLVPFVGLLLGYWFLGEAITPEKIGAGFLVVLGAVLLTLSRDFFSVGIYTLLLMGTASVFVAITDLLFKMAGLSSNYLTAVFWTYLSMAIFCLLILAVHRPTRQAFQQLLQHNLKQVLGANALNETIDVLGNVLFAFALLFAPIAIVQTTNSFQPIIVLLITIVMTLSTRTAFTERLTWATILQKGIAITIITTAGWHLYFL